MSTKFAVIYSINTGRIRWEFHPDYDEQLDDINLLDGEAVLILDNSEKALLPDLQDKISKKIGKTPTDDRFVVVDKNNNVVSIVIADPNIDSIPEHQLIPHATANLGWKLDKGTLKEPVKEEKI
jgi:hypothetical protein